MENGSTPAVSEVAEPEEVLKNGVASPVMAKLPDDAIEEDPLDTQNSNHEDAAVPAKVNSVKANGDSVTDSNPYENDSYDSESDALVIDESRPRKQKASSKKKLGEAITDDTSKEEENSDVLTHSNPFFNESLFELSQQIQQPSVDECSDPPSSNNSIDLKKTQKRKVKPKPKLKEYAQYLGLQPTVQFKCSKCGQAGFETLTTLHEHVLQCDSVNVRDTSTENSCSGFKLTRRVFLCSACGTYYENWNLYMHMLEFHRRYICLYCLGMFRTLEDLCQHIQSKHNLKPGYKNNPDEFFNVYNEPCYVVCCECNKLFNEQDNFFYHNCTGKNCVKNKKQTKLQITPENHVTGETETTINEAEKEPMNSSSTNAEDQIKNVIESVVNQHCEDDKEEVTPNMNVEESSETVAKELSENMKEVETTENHKEPNDVTMESEENMSNLSRNFEEKEDDFSDQDEDKDLSISSEQNDDHFINLNHKSNEANMKDEFSGCQNDSSELNDDKNEENDTYNTEELLDTRKVPKLSLKLPKPESFHETEDSDDSEKFIMETEHAESDDNQNVSNNEPDVEGVPALATSDPQMQVAPPDIPIIELELEQPLDKFEAHVLLQKCLKMTIPSCIFCNHARKIAVNGKQLALHCIAEHRFSAIVNSITAEELIPESFVNRLRESLEDLDKMFFNLESSFSNEAVTFSHLFECFQCYFSTTVHKELYLHNRKFHSKNLLLCIMCKSNFFSYSELICHLCPGMYVLDYDLQYRCCMCVNDDLPSSFRLMVHLRKRHNVCDVCLEMCHTQYRLSNHVWKHKLNHFCYRCGIAYRNKPDITRHLFWKHGTESMMCKKCVNKKWPHMYHFCVPPASFTCEECLQTFSRAVSLKVHKRLHTNEKKHQCTFEGCTEMFISKKLMLKHEARHRDPPEEVKVEEEVKNEEEVKDEVDIQEPMPVDEEKNEEVKVEEKPKPKIDVLDLPALNLSESDSSDSEPENSPKEPQTEDNITDNAVVQIDQEEAVQKTEEISPEQGEEHKVEILKENESNVNEDGSQDMELENTSNVMQNIWANFKNYQASKEKMDHMFVEPEKPEETFDIPIPMVEEQEDVLTVETVLLDHDYCIDLEKQTDTSIVEAEPALGLSESVDHDYCSPKTAGTVAEKPPLELLQMPEESTAPQVSSKEEKKHSESSSSSSDSDSSSCSCGTNCSCSSSSSSSSSSSDSSNSDSSTEEGRQKQLARRKKRKERAKKLKEKEKEKEKEVQKETESNKPVDVVTPAEATPLLVVEAPIRESDLETDESETDEEFYDKAPHKIAKKIQEEKRQQALAAAGINSDTVPMSIPNGTFIESTSRPPTPPAGALTVEEEASEERRKKKSKSKKRKKRKSEKKEQEELDVSQSFVDVMADVPIPPYYHQFHQQLPQTQTVAPLTLSLRNSPVPTATETAPMLSNPYMPRTMCDTPISSFSRQESSDSSLRASKRRRVPNKFYGYSSDEEEKEKSSHSPFQKWRKIDTPQAPRSPLVVPPITIKTTPVPVVPPPQPPPLTVEPISIKTGAHLSDFRVRQKQRPRPKPPRGPFNAPLLPDSATDSNDSSSDDQARTVTAQGVGVPLKPAQPQLYCYCRCPYDEVSEMIGCDASDCAIEWFHFECVGIMVPPKGQWFCPDCRKKKQQRQLMQNT